MESRISPRQQLRKLHSPTNQKDLFLMQIRTPLGDLDTSGNQQTLSTLSMRNEKSGYLQNHLSVGSLNSDTEDDRWKKRNSSAIGDRDLLFGQSESLGQVDRVSFLSQNA
jgi:hypothetical protein